MLLRSAQVQNYRSIADSGRVEFDPEITCLVGKTGSGKTSFLRMLEGVSRGVRFEERELPRSSGALQDFRVGKRPADQIVQVIAAFDVEDADRPRLPRQYEGAKTVAVRRTFDGQIDVYADGSILERASHVDETRRLPGMLGALDAGIAATIRHVRDSHPDSAAAYEENLREAVRGLGGASILNRREFEIVVKSVRNAVHALPLCRENAAKVEEALRGMSRLAEEIASKSGSDPVELLYEQVPKPLYMEGAFELDDEVTIDGLVSDVDSSDTFRCISAICGLAPGSIQRIRNADPAERAAYLEAKSRVLSRNLNDFWRQEEYRFELEIDGGLLRLRVSDKTAGATTLASERSEGFKWWMAFFLEVSAFLAGGNGRRVLLLDNPATGLHDEGKGDVLRFIRAAAESGRLQIVYSTHERALIDPWRIDRVRMVGRGKDGTRVTTVPAKPSGGQLEAIMKNI